MLMEMSLFDIRALICCVQNSPLIDTVKENQKKGHVHTA